MFEAETRSKKTIGNCYKRLINQEYNILKSDSSSKIGSVGIL
jgi:hypothetical protein